MVKPYSDVLRQRVALIVLSGGTMQCAAKVFEPRRVCRRPSNCRSKPLVSSLLARCHGLWGSQK